MEDATQDIYVLGHLQSAISNEVKVILDDNILSGWIDVSIDVGCEQIPSSFILTATDTYPGDSQVVAVLPGAPCKVAIGNDAVVTGYVDRVEIEVTPQNRIFSIQGRGKCQDLVDCSSLLPFQVLASDTLKNIASGLCDAYGINVVSPMGDGPVIPQYNITLNQTPYEIIELAARFAGYLAYENSNGDLVLAQAGFDQHGSGIALPGNAQSASVLRSMDERYQQYIPVLFSTESLSAYGPSGNRLAPVTDDGVTRNRQLVVVSELTQNDQLFAITKAKWEAARRVGRSQVAHVTVDTWRDANGALWTPNWLVELTLPENKLDDKTWVISSVNFKKGLETGTTADLVIMPKDAFLPDPNLLIPFYGKIHDEVTGGGGAAKQ